MRILVLVSIAAAALAVAAPPTAMSSSSPGVKAENSRFGRILFDGRGFVLYAFTSDARGRSACSGACAKAWPPYLVKAGAAAAIRRPLGTTRRSNGQVQLTYAGHPLYYYVGDRRPGQILCQGVAEFGGLWLVVRPNGRLVH